MKVEIVTGKTLDINAPVRVYRNLNRKDAVIWSIQQKGIVVAYATNIALIECKPVVQAGALARVRKQGQREVHAFIQGTICKYTFKTLPNILSYNPFKQDFFYDAATLQQVTSLELAVFNSDGASYKG